jgi:CHAT domain-containing protein
LRLVYLATLQNGEYDLIHFSTHAGTSNEDPLLSYIEVEGGQQIRCEDIGGEYSNFGQRHPIIIFNACKTGSQDFSLTDIQGWVTTFLNAGASAFIGTLWSVSDETSLNFIKELYHQLSFYESLEESVKRARTNCRKAGDPSWLAYELYARPNTHLLFGSK